MSPSSSGHKASLTATCSQNSHTGHCVALLNSFRFLICQHCLWRQLSVSPPSCKTHRGGRASRAARPTTPNSKRSHRRSGSSHIPRDTDQDEELTKDKDTTDKSNRRAEADWADFYMSVVTGLESRMTTEALGRSLLQRRLNS